MKLNLLPEPDGYCAITEAGSIVVPPSQFAKHNAYAIYTAEQVRAIQLEAAQAALKEAAEVCDHWIEKNYVYVNGALRCGEDIRAIKVEQP